MSVNRLNNGGSIRLNNQQQVSRQTPRNDFGSMVGRGVAAGANAMAGATAVAAPYVPGGAVVNAAAQGMAGAANSAAGGVGDYGQGGTMNIPGSAPGAGTQTGGAPASTGNAQQDMMNQTKALQEMQMSFNLQYLTLQQKMQGENRQYSTISNVLKTKHDTTKNSINNIR
ncbi:MAG: hypothetical protein OSB21_08510 [Myxococcota bacterium]|jgi:hypothetical protein|nr:hypothetical protein [Myxococcota bacterium]